MDYDVLRSHSWPDDILGRPRGLRRPLQGHSRLDAIFHVVHVYCDVVFEVNRDQTMFFVVHVDNVVLSEVILDHVEYDIFSEVKRDLATAEFVCRSLSVNVRILVWKKNKNIKIWPILHSRRISIRKLE